MGDVPREPLVVPFLYALDLAAAASL